jgi:hypothetical protein
MATLRYMMTIALAGALAASAPVASARTDAPPNGIIDADDAPDCEEFIPESSAINGVTDDGKNVSLDVYMLLDLKQGAEVARLKGKKRAAAFDDLVAAAKKLLAKAPTSYGPLNIDLKFKKWALLAPNAPSERRIRSRSSIYRRRSSAGRGRTASTSSTR